MQQSGTHRTAFLSLDRLAADPRLARRFPLDLARRFHALPVAEQDGCVTVAMADPEDQAARAAIQTALGPASCLVRMEPSVVDTMIEAAWNTVDQDPLKMLVFASSPEYDKLMHYAQEIAGLLQADLGQADLIQQDISSSNRTKEGQAKSASGSSKPINLFLFDSTDHPALHRLLVEPGVNGKRERLPAQAPRPHLRAALIAQQPRWPIRRILLIISGEEADEAALDWTLRVAQASHSAVTALAVVPPVPAMYGQKSALAQTLPALLSANTTLGRRMRNVARLLVECNIDGTLRLRQGAPDWQIRRELADKDYDFVVLGTRPRRQWLRWLEGNLLGTLLLCARQPLLIALPTSLQKG